MKVNVTYHPQTLEKLSDNDIFNFEGIVIIHKNQFIAIEESTYTEYEHPRS
jgi:hypothetical protein